MNWVLSTLDILGAVVMVSLMKEITANFGMKTEDERWALFRRCLYALVAIALMAKGVYRLEHMEEVPDWKDEGAQIVLVVYVIIFPMLRAMGFISQDKFNR